MKKWLILFLLMGVLCIPSVSFAGPKEVYEDAYKMHLAAGASVAAYHNRMGEIATRYLEQDGWEITHYVQPQNRAGARFLIATKEMEPDVPLYIVAIVGTENSKDVAIDLKTSKVYFAGQSPEEMTANSLLDDIPNDKPKVHRGFNEYIQAGATAELRTQGTGPLFLPELLQANSKSHLLLTGHSLGGAAATLVGARFIDMGLDPNQIEVITFGAPAVGNAAFAEKFDPVLKLTRVVIAGDPIVTALQGLVGGYRQFGSEVKFKLPVTRDDPHDLAGYMDGVMKNQYDKRRLAVESGAELTGTTSAKPMSGERVCIAPLKNKLPESLAGEFYYMREALYDEYRQTLPNVIISDDKASENWLENAAAANCRWLIAPEVESSQVRQEKRIYYITTFQMVYDVEDGKEVDVAVFSTGTFNLTPLEAFVTSFKGITSHKKGWLKQ